MNAYLKVCSISLIIAFLIGFAYPQSALAKSSMILGSRYDVASDEINACTAIANFIATYSSIAGYSTFNWYGNQTTANNIYTAAAGNGHLYSISFYLVTGTRHMYGTGQGGFGIANSNGL
jgi:hypothetical protein